ncbi:glycosyltransferase [Calothrix sp. 336/3]|uniref:glycosyltransferase n=1 Tax=Calothrix sp. 336/3 TaxID=1337936 RepID=UPI00069A5AA7
MIYFGTLSPWQGVNLAIEALALLNRDIPTHLTIIGQGKPYQIELCQQLVTKLQVQEKIQILEPISQNKLVEYIHRGDVVLAPLTASDRNLIQGCCPLKILEAMATGTPVVASDLPVVRELGTNGVDFLLVKPGSAKAIKDAVLQLYHDRELGKYLAAHARQRIEQFYTWECAGNSLVKGYKSIQN